MEPPPSQVTELLQRWSRGDEQALDALVPLVYEDLRRLANYHLQRESQAHTLQATALVHEVYVRMCGQQDPHWQGRGHFFAVATKMIRRILVDNARRKSAKKRGGKLKPSMLEEALTVPVSSGVDLLALEDSLQKLEKKDPRKCQVVEMRFFGGLEAKEIASVLGTTEATVRRDWKIAKAWLYRELQKGSES